jgi:hypothetical protein
MLAPDFIAQAGEPRLGKCKRASLDNEQRRLEHRIGGRSISGAT